MNKKPYGAFKIPCVQAPTNVAIAEDVAIAEGVAIAFLQGMFLRFRLPQIKEFLRRIQHLSHEQRISLINGFESDGAQFGEVCEKKKDTKCDIFPYFTAVTCLDWREIFNDCKALQPHLMTWDTFGTFFTMEQTGWDNAGTRVKYIANDRQVKIASLRTKISFFDWEALELLTKLYPAPDGGAV